MRVLHAFAQRRALACMLYATRPCPPAPCRQRKKPAAHSLAEDKPSTSQRAAASGGSKHKQMQLMSQQTEFDALGAMQGSAGELEAMQMRQMMMGGGKGQFWGRSSVVLAGPFPPYDAAPSGACYIV